LLLTQKPTKPPFTPCYFWSKRVKSWLFFGKKGKKREKIGKKVKKGKFLKTDFPKSTQKHQKNCQNDLQKPSPPDFSVPIFRKCVKDPRKSAANLANLMKFLSLQGYIISDVDRPDQHFQECIFPKGVLFF